jgi:hypothetical protein
MSNDHEIELFLKRFSPVAPPAFSVHRAVRRRRRWRTALAAAAMLLAVFGAMLRNSAPASSPARRPARPAPVVGTTVASLREAVRNGEVEAALHALDATVLPDPLRPGGALHALGELGDGYGVRRWR